jgi:hypothetical protein
MNEQQRGPWGQIVAQKVENDFNKFCCGHAWVLVGLGVLHVATVACSAHWEGFPRWPVYLLTVVLVSDALFHAWLNRCCESKDLKAWHDLLALIVSIEARAQSGPVKPSQQATPIKPVPNPGPLLRVFHSDDEPAQKGS